MHFTSIIAAAILAYTATAYPANSDASGYTSMHDSMTTSTLTASYIASAATTTASTASNASNATIASTTASASTAITKSSSAAAATATGSSGGLSLTQQLFIADTAVDRFALLADDKQFVFNFGDPKLQGKGGKGGDLVAANRKTFPALVGTGSGMAVGFLGPCGFNTPHVHLRATELQIVTEGRLMTEMVPENGVFKGGVAANGRRVIANEVKTFEMQPFYQGSVHTQFNPDCTNATFVASFNSEDFGAGQVADELLSMSDEVVSAAFGMPQDGADVDKFRKSIPASIALGVETCLKQCGISKR